MKIKTVFKWITFAGAVLSPGLLRLFMRQVGGGELAMVVDWESTAVIVTVLATEDCAEVGTW